MKKPTQTLPKESIQVEKIGSTIFSSIATIVSIIGIFLFRDWDWPVWIPTLLAGLFVIGWIADIVWLNRLDWKYFRYEVDERDVVIQTGVFFQKMVYVPMIRIQHVDIQIGPIMRKYGLAELRVHTGGSGTFEIGNIPIEEAERLCEQVRLWIKVDEDEVDAKTE